MSADGRPRTDLGPAPAPAEGKPAPPRPGEAPPPGDTPQAAPPGARQAGSDGPAPLTAPAPEPAPRPAPAPRRAGPVVPPPTARRRVRRARRGTALLVIVAVLALALVLGPRPSAGPMPAAPALPPLAELEGWLSAREEATPRLVPGAEARIRWAEAAGERTALSVVWLHGFSASPPEVSPLFEIVAEALGANLYMARLTGHGQESEDLGAARAADWLGDAAEALAIGAALGDRVIVAGSSTGATLALLATAAAEEPPAGLVLLAPNLRLASPAGRVLSLPWASEVLPRVLGPERGFTPLNADHARFWTERYPVGALFEMAAVMRAAGRIDPRRQRVPLLILASEQDRVVDTSAARELAQGWGGPARLSLRRMGPGDDPLAHVLAGDILSPGQTAPLAVVITDWIARLP